jgi:hypothetical protein
MPDSNHRATEARQTTRQPGQNPLRNDEEPQHSPAMSKAMYLPTGQPGVELVNR